MLTTSEFKNYLFSTRNYQESYRFYFLRELLSGEKTYEQIVDVYIKENEKEHTKKELIEIFKDAPTKSLLRSGVIEVNKNKINLTIEPIDSSTKESYQWLLNKYIEIWNANQSLKEVEVSDGLVIDEKKLIKFSEENNISYKKVIEITNSLVNHRNKAVVLTGPPGTGKTYTIFKLIKFLQQQYGDKSSDASLTKLVQFHPSYGYEEFIRGLKPVVDNCEYPKNLFAYIKKNKIKFDLIYSFGVIHHTKNMKKAFDSIHKLSSNKTEIKIMLYAKNSYKNFLLDHTPYRFERQKGCPVVYKVDNNDLKKIFSNKFKIIDQYQDFIFPYKINLYKKGIYEKLPYFQSMPAKIFNVLQKNIGEHLMLRMKKNKP